MKLITHMGDLDVGEIFLNFILELKARIRAGVDLTHFIAFMQKSVRETTQGSTGSVRSSQAESAPKRKL
jgi:hypothetical protein